MAEHLTTNIDILRLLSLGFSETEALNLVYMKSHMNEQIEYREMIEESRRLDFIRWLIAHNRLSH